MVADGGGWRQCADWRTESRCLSLRVGIASGWFFAEQSAKGDDGAHWKGNGPDTIGIAGGVGGKVEMEV